MPRTQTFFFLPGAIAQVKGKQKQIKKKENDKINDLRLIGTSLTQFANGLGWRSNVFQTEFTYSTGPEYITLRSKKYVWLSMEENISFLPY